MGSEIQFFDNVLDQRGTPFLRNAFDPSKVLDILFNREGLEDRVVLGAVTDQLPAFLEVFVHIHSLDFYRSGCRFFFTSEDLKGGRFSCTVDSKEPEAFATTQPEREIFDGAERLAWVEEA